MRISQIILRVADLDRAVGFWNGVVGFEEVMRFEAFAFLDAGDIQLILNQVAEAAEDSSWTEIVIEFDDVRAAFDKLSERGVPFEVELRPVTSDGVRDLLAAHFHDPDGHAASVTGWVDSADQS
jgi:catechol 2,3-dioxygenase-like lactoylglutathione lyase family enzyme